LAAGAALLAGGVQGVELGRIMPMGDSITDGVPVAGGYRDPLYSLLNGRGDTLTLVGSASDNATPTLSTAGQTHHEGHSGYVIAAGGGRTGLDENLAGWIGADAENPDRILLMIGSNDINIGYDMANAPARLSTLVTHIYSYRPGVKLFLASIIPMSGHEADVRVFNTAIPGIVASHVALGHNVIYVPMYESLNINTDLSDGLHPNALGYQHMAQAWDSALHGVSEPASIHALDVTSHDGQFGYNNTFSVGWDFTVTQAITVTALGQFDPDSNPQDNTLAIYQRGGAKLAEASVLAASPAVPSGIYNARYSGVANLVLTPGNYVVMSTQHTDNFVAPAGSVTAAFGPGITWNKGVALAAGSQAGPLPATAPATWPIENASAARYFGPTFKYQLGSIADAKILSFGGPDYPAIIDDAAGTVVWTVPYGTVVATLAATYTLSAGATCNQPNGSIPTPAFGGSAPVVFEITSADGKVVKDYAVTVVVAPRSAACDMLTFGPGAVVNPSAQSVVWTVPPGTDVQHLAPVYTISASATCSPGSGTSRDFTTPQTYTITAQNGVASKTYTVTVVVLAPPPVGGYARWFGASTLVGKSDGDPVVSWADYSANAANATVPGGHASPTFVADGGAGNGLAALHFTPGGGGSAALKFAEDSSIRTVFSVFKGSSFLLTDIQSGQYHFHRWGQNGVDSDPTVPIWDGPGGSWASPNIRGGSTYVNGLLVNGTTYNMPTALHNGFNLVEVVTTGAVTADSWNADRNTVHTGDQYQSEVIIYDGVLSEDERVSVEHYLMSKWFGVVFTPQAKIVSFGLPNMPSAIDNSANTVTWFVPYGTDVTNLAPAYTLAYGATCDKPSGSLRNFSSPVTYTVTSSDALITTLYTVTVEILPDWPTLINMNFAANAATDNLNGIYSFDATASGSASRAAPAAYSGNTWNDCVGSPTASGTNLMDSRGTPTAVGFTLACNNGPWDSWTGLGSVQLLKSAVGADFTAYTPVLTLAGLDTGHAYDIYIASLENDNNRAADFLIGATSKHVADSPSGAIDWMEGRNYVHFAGVIPQPDGTVQVKAQGGGGGDGIVINGVQLQDMGARGPNPEALIYAFNFAGIGTGATTLSGAHIAVAMWTGTPVTALRPTFATSTGATCTVGGKTIVSGDAVDFTNPVHITIKSEDGATTADYTVTVNLIPSSGHLHVNLDNVARTGLVGPAPFSGAGKSWNAVAGAKTGSALLDEDGVTTGVGFNFNNFEGTGSWGNPPLKMLNGAVWWWSQNNGGEGVGVRSGVISGLTFGGKYDLYIASMWADQFSHGTFTVNGASQDLDGQAASQSAWVAGANYVLFPQVAPDATGNITITATATQKGGGDYPLMISGFQLLDTGVKSPYCDMLSFGPGAIIAGTNISWVVPYGTNLATLAPAFTTTGMATCSQPNHAVPTPNFSSGPVVYKVTAQDGIAFKNFTVTVSVVAPPVANGLVCWYDAGGGITQDDSGVLTWYDVSGNGHNATRGSHGAPGFVPNEVNSRPAVHLRGNNNILDCAGAMFTKQQYVVVRSPNTNWSGGGSFLGRASNDFLSVRSSSYNLDSGTTGFWQDHFPTAVSKNGTPVSMNANHNNQGQAASGCGFALDAITSYMILKITVDDQGGDVANSSYPYYQIGQNETLGSCDMDIAEIMGFDHALSEADENSVGSYLSIKYGLQTAYVSSGSYATWAGAGGYNLTGGPDADDDHDGISNVMEYALGLNPKVPNGSPGTLSGRLVSFTKGSEARNNGDVTYSIETSPNLHDPWTTVVSHAPGNTDLAISYLLPSGQGKIFARLKVTSTATVLRGNYTTWASAHQVTGGPSQVGPDGIANVLLYALDLKLDGTNGSPGTLSGNVLSFTKRQDAITNQDVGWVIETSPDLRPPWTPRVVQAAGNSAPTISYVLPPNQGKIFARLAITQGP